MEYNGFTLDPFQEKAIKEIHKGNSVLVSAPTGAGKTLIADYAVERTLQRRKSCIYTSPLKALSNQKYRDFCALFGPENVGIMTGDVVIQIDAPLLIMTTEVLRNILHRDIGRVDQVEYVIFDEMHFLSNFERGTVWEECLILLPEDKNILGLSATVKNVDELARWLSEIKNTPVKHIVHKNRPVPLKILGYTVETGLLENAKIDSYREQRIKKIESKKAFISSFKKGMRRGRDPYSQYFKDTSHRNLIREISPDYLPCLYFIFSRQKCENSAYQLDIDLTTPNEKEEIEKFLQPVEEKYGQYESTNRLCTALRSGIGYHHAGLFPFLKELVEKLYEKKLIKVLYCTSTFALGVNMPAKSAIFNSLVKFDGKRVRPLTPLEFFQKAGRAGRRGMDEVGYVIVNRNFRDFDAWPGYREDDIEPIVSALNLSYNSIINLLEKYSLNEIKTLLANSLWTFQHRNQIVKQEESLQFILGNLEELKGYTIEKHPDAVDKIQKSLNTRLNKLNSKRTSLKNQLSVVRKKKQEIILYQEMDKTERQIKEIRDQIKNNETLGFVLVGKKQRSPGRKVRKMLSQMRRTHDKISYFKEYLFNIFQEKVQILFKLGFVDEELNLLSQAEIAKYLYIQELFVTKLLASGIIESLDEYMLNALFNCIGQAEKRRDIRNKKPIPHPFKQSLLKKIHKFHDELREAGADRFDAIEFNLQYASVAFFWSQGYSFSQILDMTELQEGDIISSFRQTIDLLKQCKDVFYMDPTMLAKLNTCIDLMDRDVVKVIL